MKTINRTALTTVAATIMLALFTVDLAAQELNKRRWPSPQDQATVSRLMSKSRLQDSGINRSDGEVNQDCGDISIGNIQQDDSRGGRNTGRQQNITIVTGPVVSTCGQ